MHRSLRTNLLQRLMSLSNKSKSRIKAIVNLTLVVLGIGFFVALFLFKGSMNNMV